MPDLLFKCLTLGPGVNDSKPEVITPLGTLEFDAEFDGVLIGDLKPSSAYSLKEGGHLFTWTLDGITAELLLCRPGLIMPDNIVVDDCWAGIWRLRTTLTGERPAFSCRWKPGFQWIERGPDSGEGLDAQTWEDGSVKVTVGTADAPWLAGHAKRGFLPRRWAEELGSSYGGIAPDPQTGRIDPVQYLEDGFRLVLPPLNTGEMCQVQFLIAWSNKFGTNTAEANDAWTWYAVDQSPESILSSAGWV